MSDDNNFYDEWDDYDPPSINYNTEIVSHRVDEDMGASSHMVVLLSDSSNNSSDKTVEYNIEDLKTSPTKKLPNKNTMSSEIAFSQCLVLPNAHFAMISSKDKISEENNTTEILSQTAKRKKVGDSKQDKLQKKIENDKIKEIKKNELLKEKRLKSILSAQQRSMKPDEVIKQLVVNIDTNVVNSAYGSLIIPALQKENIQYNVNFLKHKNTITWGKVASEPYVDDTESICLREVKSNDSTILEIMSWKMLIELIHNNMLINHINSVKGIGPVRLIIVIIELNKYLHYQSNKLNRALKSTISGSQQQKTKKVDKDLDNAPKLSTEDIEMALTQAQLKTDTCHRRMESSEDLANFVFQTTRSISQIDSKRDRTDKDQQTLSWFAKADSKSGVNVDKNGNGLLQLWQQQLCQFNNVGLEVAQAIISHYKSPLALLSAYKECHDLKEAEDLLSNITIRREAGILSSSRRVGNELSKRIHRFFTSADPSVPV